MKELKEKKQKIVFLNLNLVCQFTCNLPHWYPLLLSHFSSYAKSEHAAVHDALPSASSQVHSGASSLVSTYVVCERLSVMHQPEHPCSRIWHRTPPPPPEMKNTNFLYWVQIWVYTEHPPPPNPTPWRLKYVETVSPKDTISLTVLSLHVLCNSICIWIKLRHRISLFEASCTGSVQFTNIEVHFQRDRRTLKATNDGKGPFTRCGSGCGSGNIFLS